MKRSPRALDRCSDLKTVRRFFSHLSPCLEGSCWKWTGHLNSYGYGHFRVDGRTEYAHRFSYALFNNGIASGMSVDHLCGNSWCVNPNHFRLLTMEENRANGVGREKDMETGYLSQEGTGRVYPERYVPF